MIEQSEPAEGGSVGGVATAGPAGGSKRMARALTVAAVASMSAGAIHAAAIGSHGEHRGLAELFMAIALFQVGWGVLALGRPTRGYALAGAIGNGALFVGWVVVRTVGVPFISGLDKAGSVQAAGQTFVGYSEDLPMAGYTGCDAGNYARRHNPWVNFPALPTSVNQPSSAMPADFSNLPTVSLLVPNVCNDMHNCGVAAGDDWARAHLSGYVSWAQQHNSLLVVTFDEDNGSSANHIATFLVGPMVTAGASDQQIDHYSLLRTLEDMYGLPPLGQAADAEPLSGIWID